jgi:hypothetical protein
MAKQNELDLPCVLIALFVVLVWKPHRLALGGAAANSAERGAAQGELRSAE